MLGLIRVAVNGGTAHGMWLRNGKAGGEYDRMCKCVFE